MNNEKALHQAIPQQHYLTKNPFIEPYKRWEFDIENENIKGHWIGIFYKCNDKTTIEFTENINFKKWYLKPFISRYLRKQQYKYYSVLKHKLDNA